MNPLAKRQFVPTAAKRTGGKNRRNRFVSLLRLLLISVVILVVFPAENMHVANAQSKADEYRVKAAFLFHFAQLVDWPSEALGGDEKPLTFCTIGDDPFQGGLESTVEGKQIGPHSLRVRHTTQPQEVRGCQLLFVSSGEGKSIPALLAGYKESPILTVGENDGFLQQGGMIRFCLENNKVRFEINLESAEHAKLKISSRLLQLAKSVIGVHGQG